MVVVSQEVSQLAFVPQLAFSSALPVVNAETTANVMANSKIPKPAFFLLLVAFFSEAQQLVSYMLQSELSVSQQFEFSVFIIYLFYVIFFIDAKT